MLERLESISSDCLSLRNAVAAVSCIDSLRTPLAKARGWIRQILNTNSGLEHSLQAMNLLLSEKWSAHALLDPRLGIPTPVLKILSLLTQPQALETPHLFRQLDSIQINPYNIHKTRELIDRGDLSAISPSFDSYNIYLLVQILVQWLYELPEPLFGYDHYDAFLACQEVEDIPNRIRNLSILIDESSWYNKPMIIKLIHYLRKCVSSPYFEKNGLNVVAVSVLFTPVFLRPYMSATQRKDIDSWQMAVSAAGSNIMSFLLTHEEAFEPISTYLSTNQTNLTLKCNRLRKLQENISKGYIVTLFSSDIELSLFKDLYKSLYEVANLMKIYEINIITDNKHHNSLDIVNESDSMIDIQLDNDLDKDISDMLSDIRWTVCGFPSDNPTKDFENNGLLGLQCLISFFKKYPTKAASITLKIRRARLYHCNISSTAVQLAKITSQVLNLTPHPESDDKPLAHMARQTHTWTLLSHIDAFNEVFDLSFFTFDESWKYIVENQHSNKIDVKIYSDVVYETQLVLNHIINKLQPTTISSMWDHWIKIKLQRYEHSLSNNSSIDVSTNTSSNLSNNSSSTALDNHTIISPSKVDNKKDRKTHIIGGSKILGLDEIMQLEQGLPTSYQCYNWHLLYRLSKDGSNLNTLINSASTTTSTIYLLIILDSNGSKFGGLITSRLGTSNGGYIGTNDTNVFTFIHNNNLEMYSSSGSNSYYLLTTHEVLALGGGGDFAIYLDSDLQGGSSGPCATFNSPFASSFSISKIMKNVNKAASVAVVSGLIAVSPAHAENIIFASPISKLVLTDAKITKTFPPETYLTYDCPGNGGKSTVFLKTLFNTKPKEFEPKTNRAYCATDLIQVEFSPEELIIDLPARPGSTFEVEYQPVGQVVTVSKLLLK
eukprot:gene18158-23814_t